MLNQKQKRFITEYIKNPNATQAAINAGYSKDTAGEQGCRLLKNVKIGEAIREKLNREDSQATITIEEIVNGLKAEAAGAETGSARVAAWSHLAKYMGMFKERVELTGADGGPIKARLEIAFAGNSHDKG